MANFQFSSVQPAYVHLFLVLEGTLVFLRFCSGLSEDSSMYQFLLVYNQSAVGT
jgi:hypothetical protein